MRRTVKNKQSIIIIDAVIEVDRLRAIATLETRKGAQSLIKDNKIIRWNVAVSWRGKLFNKR